MGKYVCDKHGEVSFELMVKIGNHKYCPTCVVEKMFKPRIKELTEIEDEVQE